MTASPQRIPRCEICDWPLADSQEKGCIPGDCSYRPDDPAEQQRIRRRREALSTSPSQPTDGREALRQLFTRELRNERYEFVTSAPFPGWSYMKSPGESDIGMHQSFISFLATCVELEKWPTSRVEAPVPQPTSPSVDAETLLSCPFCGGRAGVLKAGGKHQACCADPTCPANGIYDTHEEAATIWNTRALSAPRVTSPAVDADGEMIERVENILRSKKTVSYPSYAAAEYVREQLQELLLAYLRLRKQTGGEK